jgi:DNA-binding CsgD family transcriptional regulator
MRRFSAVPLGHDHLVEYVTLTRREIRILREICTGDVYKQIAWRMEISPGTLKVQVSRLCSGLGVRGRRGLALWARFHPEVLRAPDMVLGRGRSVEEACLLLGRRAA